MTRLNSLLGCIVEDNPMQRPFFDKVVPGILPAERDDLERYVAHCEAHGVDLRELAASYDLIVKDTLREQVYFRRHGRYRFSRYAEVAGSVYMNPAYMSRYMHGLALTAFLWPNHAGMRRWFAGKLPSPAQGGRYLEVGPGHGFYFMAALRSGAFTACDGVDVSPTSVALTRSLLAGGRFGSFTGWQVEERDFFTGDVRGDYDFLTMGEVLEHVEDPVRFLSRAREQCRAGATLFVTTCINSPAYDHIHLFRTVEDVASVVHAASLTIRDQLVLPYTGTTLEESAAQKLPVNIALVLSP